MADRDQTGKRTNHGFSDEAVQLLQPSPGVEAVTLLYGQYAEHLRLYETYTTNTEPISMAVVDTVGFSKR